MSEMERTQKITPRNQILLNFKHLERHNWEKTDFTPKNMGGSCPPLKRPIGLKLYTSYLLSYSCRFMQKKIQFKGGRKWPLTPLLLSEEFPESCNNQWRKQPFVSSRKSFLFIYLFISIWYIGAPYFGAMVQVNFSHHNESNNNNNKMLT